jgi:protease I
MNDIKGKSIAILVDDFFEEVEMTGPKDAFLNAGAKVDLISCQQDLTEVQGLNHQDKGKKFKVDKSVEAVSADNYDALILPGGVVNADHLRTNKPAQSLVKAMVAAGKPVAIICHAPWILIDAGLAKGRRVTSFSSLKSDLLNAGAYWVDAEVVIDGTIITSRTPDDIPAFNKAITTMI